MIRLKAKENLQLGLSLLGTLQSDNQRDLELKLLGSLDDTLGNDVASHDTTNCDDMSIDVQHFLGEGVR